MRYTCIRLLSGQNTEPDSTVCYDLRKHYFNCLHLPSVNTVRERESSSACCFLLRCCQCVDSGIFFDGAFLYRWVCFAVAVAAVLDCFYSNSLVAYLLLLKKRGWRKLR